MSLLGSIGGWLKHEYDDITGSGQPAIPQAQAPQQAPQPQLKMAQPTMQNLQVGPLNTPQMSPTVGVAAPQTLKMGNTSINPTANITTNATNYAPSAGDVSGLKNALSQMHLYGPDDQIRILQRSGQAGLIPHNVNRAIISGALQPQPYSMPSKLDSLGNAVADVATGGLANLARTGGINLAANNLYDKVAKGQMDYSTVSNTVNPAYAEQGYTPNESGLKVARTAAGQAISGATNLIGFGSGLSKAADIAKAVEGAKAASFGSRLADAGKMGVAYGVPAGIGQTLQEDNPSLKSLGKNVAVNTALMSALPAGTAALKEGIRLAPDAIRSVSDNLSNAGGWLKANPLNEIGAVGKNVNPEIPKEVNPTQSIIPSTGNPVIDPMQSIFEQNNKAMESRPNITPELKNINDNPELRSLYNTEPTVGDRVIANSTGGSPADVANARVIKTRNADAERQILEHLQNGGTRNEAIGIYQKLTGDSEKMAKFKVQRAAKQADQALNVNAQSDNPLLDKYKLKTPESGNYNQVSTNHRIVQNSIKLAGDRALSYDKKLSVNDRNNFADYAQGVRDINKAENPKMMQEAVDSWRTAADTTHALGENFGHTAHGADYFPGYWDRSDPKVQDMEKHAAEQKLEENMGSQEWQKLSNDEKQKLLGEYMSHNIDSGENYGGYHNKSKTFQNRAEGIEAGYKPLNENPFDDMRRYFNGAKMSLGNQAIIQGVQKAGEDFRIGESGKQKYSIDLPGDKSVRVEKSGYKVLRNTGVGKPIGIIKKAWIGTNRTVIKSIVANPLIHGQNQEFNALFSAAWNMPGNKIANMSRIVKNQLSLKGDALDNWRTEFYRNGGFSPDYGKDTHGFIAKGIEKVGIDPKRAEILPSAMASLEQNIRVALYKSGIEAKMKPADVIKTIDHALGDSKMMDDMASTFGLFLHYLKTNVNIGGRAVGSLAKGNVLPLIGIATGAAAWYAANKAWQEATGNPNASVRAPGVLGTTLQIAKAPSQIAQGRVPSVITSHINPLINYVAGAAFNKDLQKPVRGEQSNNNKIFGPGNEGLPAYTFKSLFGQSAPVSNVSSGKQSVAEAGIGSLLGLYTPHVNGNVASPNIPFLNTPNAQTATQPNKIGSTAVDPTGIQQERNFYANKDSLLNSLAGPQTKGAYDAVNNFIDRDRTTDGKTILASQKETVANWGSVAASPTAQSALQKFYQSQPNHNPEWDIQGNGTLNGTSTSKIQLWSTYKSLAPGDLQRDVISQQNPWINTTQQSVSDWGNKQTFSGNVVKSPDYVPFPTITPSQQQLMTSATNLASIPAANRTADQINQLSQLEGNPDLKNTYSAIQNYNNTVRESMHLPTINYSPNASPEVQNFTSKYMASDANGRQSIKSQFPSLYNQMETAIEQQQLATVDKQGGIGYYGGQQAPSFLSSIYGLGNYDISKTKNANGTTSYSLLDFTSPAGTKGTTNTGLSTVSAATPGVTSSAGASNGKRLRRIKVKRMKIRHVKLAHPHANLKIYKPQSSKKIQIKKIQVAKLR